MTGKVKITQEQADAIERLKEGQREDFQKFFKDDKDSLVSWAVPLSDLTEDEYMSVLYDGYEIEPEYKTGEWVRYWKNDCVTAIGKITYIDYEKGLVQFDNTTFTKEIHDVTGYATPEEIKTEKERRLWKSIGREVGEFKETDSGFDYDGILVPGIIALTQVYSRGDLQGFYPAESYIDLVEVEPNATTHN